LPLHRLPYRFLQGGINLLFASISDAANSSRRSQQYKQ
jgi:hypothetical protein